MVTESNNCAWSAYNEVDEVILLNKKSGSNLTFYWTKHWFSFSKNNKNQGQRTEAHFLYTFYSLDQRRWYYFLEINDSKSNEKKTK